MVFKFTFMSMKGRYIYIHANRFLKERKRKSGVMERDRERSAICRFTSQIPRTARIEPGQNQGPGFHPGHPHKWLGPKYLNHQLSSSRIQQQRQGRRDGERGLPSTH